MLQIIRPSFATEQRLRITGVPGIVCSEGREAAGPPQQHTLHPLQHCVMTFSTCRAPGTSRQCRQPGSSSNTRHAVALRNACANTRLLLTSLESTSWQRSQVQRPSNWVCQRGGASLYPSLSNSNCSRFQNIISTFKKWAFCLDVLSVYDVSGAYRGPKRVLKALELEQ